MATPTPPPGPAPNDDLWDWEIDPKPPVQPKVIKDSAPTVMAPPDPFEDGEEIELSDLSEDPFANRGRAPLDSMRPGQEGARKPGARGPLSEVEEVDALDFSGTEDWQFDPIAAAPPLPHFPPAAQSLPPIVPTTHGSRPMTDLLSNSPTITPTASLPPNSPITPVPSTPPSTPSQAPSSASTIRGGSAPRGATTRFKATQAFNLPVPPGTDPTAPLPPPLPVVDPHDSPTVRPAAPANTPPHDPLPPPGATRASSPPRAQIPTPQARPAPVASAGLPPPIVRAPAVQTPAVQTPTLQTSAAVPPPAVTPPPVVQAPALPPVVQPPVMQAQKPPTPPTPPATFGPESLNDPAPSDRRTEMRERFEAGDFAGALLLSESLLQSNPRDADAKQVSDVSRQKLRGIYAGRLGNLQQIPRVIVPHSELRWLTLDHRAGFVLSLIDGSLTLEDILDVSAMPALEVLRTLYNLSVQRVIELRPPRR